MFISKKHLSRRAVLRGAGAAISMKLALENADRLSLLIERLASGRTQ